MKPEHIKRTRIVTLPAEEPFLRCCDADHDYFSIERDGQSWSIGNYDFRLNDLHFCPFCGTELPVVTPKTKVEEYRELPPMDLSKHTMGECLNPSSDGDGYCRTCKNPLVLHPGYFA